LCKKAPGKIARHQVLCDIVWRAFGAAGIPAVNEPSGLDRQDDKPPVGLTLIPSQGGRSLGYLKIIITIIKHLFSNVYPLLFKGEMRPPSTTLWSMNEMPLQPF